jgi:hypothetical protein
MDDRENPNKKSISRSMRRKNNFKKSNAVIFVIII